jgi:hypothetical protein
VRHFDDYNQQRTGYPNLPADLGLPIEHLTKTFSQFQTYFGQIIGKACYYRLHIDESDDAEEYLYPIRALHEILDVPTMQRFFKQVKTDIAPRIFKAFFALYLDCMTSFTLTVFTEFVAIGEENETRIGMPCLDWALTQTKILIRNNDYLVRIWVRNVCDKRPDEECEDVEELIFWQHWRAPRLLSIRHAVRATYEAERTWERLEAEESRQLLERLTQEFISDLDKSLDKIAGPVALELAKQSRPTHKSTSSSQHSPIEELQTRAVASPRRDARRKATQAKHQSWQKEYQGLKKANPDRPGTWISVKISKMRIAQGCSAETIRKHMKS